MAEIIIVPVPKEILELVERFDRQAEAYKSGQYNETQLRREFLDPFFKALGWDMDNAAGFAEPYKDVVHEDAIRVSGGLKAPDYAFRIGGTRKFFVEAKRPSVDIQQDASPALQLRIYAWSDKLPLSILTDFEEFAVYDGRFPPHKGDAASTARIFYCTFREYAEKWDWIASIFSKDAVQKGLFDKFTASTKAKHGTVEVDEHFLATIEGWRVELARNIALRNPSLTQRELNFAVQRIIDRIVFLRICEDRGIEDYGCLRGLVNGDRIYPRLCQLFQAADRRYNSGLFHFQKEAERHEQPDELTLDLKLDDRLLRDILRALYYPDSPYQFAMIPSDILGQVYEQFLGKVIRLTEGHQAKVDEKSEVKKAGGVYYTPTYIVEYIVRQTVAQLVEGKTPKQVSVLRILDPACGSGSFLMGAYQFLLDWHRDYYAANDPGKWARGAKPALLQTQGGGWKLTISERKRILLNNIFGVDIDAQAVEVTKLSLLLKVLEGETGQALQTILKIFHERALPDLGDNIKCGNSLIGPDFYQQGELALSSDEDRQRVNIFDWHAEFPQIVRRNTSFGELRETPAASPLDYTMPGVPLHGRYAYKTKKGQNAIAPSLPIKPGSEGGFDAVIGNPPYVRIQGFPSDQIEYFSRRYESATGNFDLYIPFLERGIQLLRPGGQLGMITPNKFLRTDYGRGLRRVLSSDHALRRIVDFGASQVFKATTYTCLLFLQRGGVERFDVAEAAASASALAETRFRAHSAACLNQGPWTFEDAATEKLLAKMTANGMRLLQLPAEMSRGSSTGDDHVFVLDSKGVAVEAEALRVPLFASDFGRYHFAPSGKWKVIFPYRVERTGFRLLTEQELRLNLPKTFRHLSEHQAVLKKRKQFIKWFGYSAPRNLQLHDQAHIAVSLLADRGMFALIPPAFRGQLCPMASGGFTITLGKSATVRPEYVLGLLNSKLLFWRLRKASNLFRGGWITCTKQYFGELPIRAIDFGNKSEKAAHDRMVKMVEQMHAWHAQLAVARTPQENTALERQIAATDAQIDRLVYDLYGLTEEEIRVVEGTP